MRVLVLFLFIQSAYASVFEPHVKWDKNQIETCFMDKIDQKNNTQVNNIPLIAMLYGMNPTPLNAKQAEQVQASLESEFSLEKTAIEFTGFKKCSESPFADLVIMNNQSFQLFGKFEYNLFSGVASIGQAGQMQAGGYYVKEPKQAFMLLKSFDKTVIIHEAGHVLGLRHEHILEDAKTDMACVGMEAYVNGELGDEVFDSTETFKVYDPESIMNYCYMSTLKAQDKLDEGGLSPQDIELLISMYQGL